jgi:hypothetical protein
MNANLHLPSSLYFQGTGPNDDKKLKFAADKLESHFNAYVVKVNQTDTQYLILSDDDKSNKFTDDAGTWYMLGLLKIGEKSHSGDTYDYYIGKGDGESDGDQNEAARISIVYSATPPDSGSNITTNTLSGDALISGNGIPNGFELNVKDNQGGNRYAQFFADPKVTGGNYFQTKVKVLFFDGNGIWRGIYEVGSLNDNVYVDLNAFSTGFFMIGFVKKDYDPEGNPSPGFPYTFNVGDPKFDGTIKVEEE